MSTLENNIEKLQEILETVNSLEGAKEISLQDKTITPTNNQQIVNADNGYDGLGTVIVEAVIEQEITLQDKTVIPTENQQTVTADEGFYGLGIVTVEGVEVQEITLQEKTVTPTDSQQVVTPDTGYDGLSKVTVEGVDLGITPSGELAISDNGTYDVTNYASAIVNVASGGGNMARVEVYKDYSVFSIFDEYCEVGKMVIVEFGGTKISRIEVVSSVSGEFGVESTSMAVLVRNTQGVWNDINYIYSTEQPTITAIAVPVMSSGNSVNIIT